MNQEKREPKATDLQKEEIPVKVSAPSPLPNDYEDLQRKIKTNRVPRPAPQKPDSTSAKSEEPISSETISMKRSSIKEDTGPNIDLEKRKIKILCYHCGQKLDLSDMQPFSEVECPSCNVKIIVPKWFENYLLEEPGGEGGMAIVYRALDLTLDREVAIKILNSSFAAEADRSQLFLHEARTAATINHYAVIPVYTCGISEGKPYIVMQYMDGGSLDSKLSASGGNLPISQILKWIKDVADGLDNARRHGIIHHDVKPANILLDNDGNAKIGDFGIAQVIHDWRSENISKITKGWASPNYVSPEKVMTGQEDHYGDIYSLGVSLFQLLTGKLPFDDPDVGVLIRMRLERDPLNPKDIRPEIPLKIANLATTMMNRSPDKRPSYREIINEIDAHIKLSESSRKSTAREDSKKKVSKTQTKIKAVAREPNAHQAAQKGFSVKTLIHCGISLLIFTSLFFLWKLGFFDSMKGSKKSVEKIVPTDLLPEITEALRVGNPAKAAELANAVLQKSESDPTTLKQAAIQYAIALYLQNISDAKDKCVAITEKMSALGIDKDDPAMLIMRFMSNGETESQKMQEGFTDDDFYRTVASYCLYIKSIYAKQSGLGIVSLSRRCLSDGEKVPKSFWGNALSDRVTSWKEWMDFGKGDSNKLEPLIAANKYEIVSKTTVSAETAVQPKEIQKETVEEERPTRLVMKPRPVEKSDLDITANDEKTISNLNISSLNARWLEQDRKTFAGPRPRPADYNFFNSQIERYISGVEASRREAESVRIRQVQGIKNYLCQLLDK
ncbi:MAG TPA: serine/threonine-protein kinase, partial [Victivallales bacterium]|nr:serine/threonine-protein kinase [Victivallales bacterium]